MARAPRAPEEKVGDPFRSRLVDGTRVSSGSLDALLLSHKAGDQARLLISRRQQVREVEVTLGVKTARSFRITRTASPSPLQAAIRRDWLQE